MVNIVTRAEWGARSATNRTLVSTSRRTTYVVHYDGDIPISVPDDCLSGCGEQIRGTQSYHMDGRGWADIGYNFWICQHGTVYEGRGWDVLGAHAGATGNVVGIGVQIHIGSNQEPSAAALAACAALKADADRHCDKVLAWGKHNDFMSTSCPGEPLMRWLANGHPSSGSLPSRPLPVESMESTFTPAFIWDGSSFPGEDAFRLGQSHPAVTLLGQRLQAHGFTGYQVGPGPVFSEVDQRGVREFQQAQGWTGSDADGYPGPETWARLMADSGAAPTPAPPSSGVPVLRLSHVIVAVSQDSASDSPTGAVHYGDPAGAVTLEHALANVVPYDGPFDGSLGTNFKRAYAEWQRSLGYTGRDADGVPGSASLNELARRTGMFTVVD